MSRASCYPPSSGQPVQDKQASTPPCPRPLADQRAGHPMADTPGIQQTQDEHICTYRWIEGDCLKNYSSSAIAWKTHTATPEFHAAFAAVAKKYEDDNATRAAKIEEFMLAEAMVAGVLKTTTKRISKNPNKWAKHMAPWFNEKCKAARARYRSAVHTNGKLHTHSQEALKQFAQQCKKARAHM